MKDIQLNINELRTLISLVKKNQYFKRIDISKHRFLNGITSKLHNQIEKITLENE